MLKCENREELMEMALNYTKKFLKRGDYGEDSKSKNAVKQVY